MTESNLMPLLSIILTAQIEEIRNTNVTEINSTDTEDSGPMNFPSKVNERKLNFCSGKSY